MKCFQRYNMLIDISFLKKKKKNEEDLFNKLLKFDTQKIKN